MILIGDSGSTKTHWAWAGSCCSGELVTQGLNPRLTEESVVAAVLREVKLRVPQEDPLCELFFYGAGCGSANMCDKMREQLERVFVGVRIEVHGDLLGACRAACGHRAGVVGILGTGSNACYYDGGKIVRQRVSTGYLLGDEGSGNHIGRLLLKDYLEERMPRDLASCFHDTYPLSTGEFLDRIYRQPYPNRFLASLASFASRHQGESYINGVLEFCFGAFFDQLDYCYAGVQNKGLNLVGGLIGSFSDKLLLLSQQRGQRIDSMIADPMYGLLKYHQG